MQSNVALLKGLIADGYGDRNTLGRRIRKMEAWLASPKLLVADADAQYAATTDIDLNSLCEPLLCAPDDPDDVRPLSALSGVSIDEVFIGSCMTRVSHYRATGELLRGHKGQLPARLWLTPPTRMDANKLREEGWFSVFGQRGGRIEIPGCSLCMGNQARVANNATVVSTSTRNFPNRLGNGAHVYLASAEVAAICARLGRLPTKEEYFAAVASLVSCERP